MTASTNRSCKSWVQRSLGLGSAVRTRQGSPLWAWERLETPPVPTCKSSCVTIPSWGCISLGYILVASMRGANINDPRSPKGKDGNFLSQRKGQRSEMELVVVVAIWVRRRKERKWERKQNGVVWVKTENERMSLMLARLSGILSLSALFELTKGKMIKFPFLQRKKSRLIFFLRVIVCGTLALCLCLCLCLLLLSLSFSFYFLFMSLSFFLQKLIIWFSNIHDTN